MSLELVTAGLKEKIGEDCGLGSILKFDFGDDGCGFPRDFYTPSGGVWLCQGSGLFLTAIDGNVSDLLCRTKAKVKGRFLQFNCSGGFWIRPAAPVGYWHRTIALSAKPPKI